METTLFYFSATGNSLSVTRNLASELGNCEIVPIAKVIGNTTINVSSLRVGIIFPVYAWGMPRIVEEFVSKLTFSNKPYIFAIATCVAIQGNTLKDLDKKLRQKGANLSAGFAVRAGRSSLMKLNTLDHIMIKLDRQRMKNKSITERLSEIAITVQKLERHRPENSSRAAGMFGSLFHGLAVNSFKQTDTGFMISDSCTGCGNCSRICPRSNITLENGHPVFHHNCELCHACIQWCPNFAIKHPNFDITLKQYRNSEIQVKDMIIPTMG